MGVSPLRALADDLKSLAAEMAPLSGYVIKPSDGDFLIDLDASKGLRTGDLLSVSVKGEKIVHPITQKVIGTLDAVKTVLRVTRIKSGYSYAKWISGEKTVKDGARIRRFSGLTAALYTTSPEGQKVYKRLRELLPELEWQGKFQLQPALGNDVGVNLSFILNGGVLQLIDGAGQPIRTLTLSAPPVFRQPQTTPQPMVQSPGQNVNPSPGGVQWGSAKSAFDQTKALGELSGKILMASFLKEEGRILLATVDGSWVRVYEITNKLQLLGETQVDAGTASPLAVAWWRPEPTGPSYLAVTAALETLKSYGNIKETSLSGTIFDFDNQRLSPLVTRVPYFMATYDLNDDGQAEILLGQEFDPHQTYGRTYALHLNRQQLQTEKPPFTLPARFILPGSTLGDLDGDHRPELVTVNNGNLTIFSDGKKVYSSTGQMGGSLASLSYDVNPGLEDTLFETVHLDIQPTMQDIDGDGVVELLLVASDTSSFRIRAGTGLKSSWVAVVKYRNGAYDQGRLAPQREYPLQGLWADAGNVFLVESKENSSPGKKAQSKLLIFPTAPAKQ